MIITTKAGQSIFDVSIQYFGTLEYLFTDVLEPNTIQISDILGGGQELKIENDNKGIESIKNEILTANLSFENVQTEEPADLAIPDMEIGQSFIIR